MKKTLINILKQVHSQLSDNARQIFLLSARVAKTTFLPKEQRFLLSDTQKRFWLFKALYPTSSAHNMSLGLRIERQLDINTLKQALLHLSAEQQLLRAVLNEKAQCLEIRSHLSELPFCFYDLSKTTAEIYAGLQQALYNPFHEEHLSLWRLLVIQQSESVYELHLVMHHLICDAASFGLFFRQLATHYQSVLEKNESHYFLDKYCFYPTVSQTQEVLDEDKIFWKRVVSNYKQTNLFQKRYPQSVDYAPIQLEINDAIGVRAESLALSEYLYFLAAFYLTLAEHFHHSDLVIGSMLSSRKMVNKETIGCYSNALPIFLSRESETLGAWLKELAANVYELFRHQKLPLQEIIALSDQPINRERGLFECLFVYQNTLGDVHQAFDEEGKTYWLDHDHLKSYPELPLFLHIRKQGEGYQATFEFQNDKLSSQEVTSIGETFISFLNKIPELLTCQINELATRKSIVHGKQIAITPTLADLFLFAEKNHSSQVALYCADGNTYTYRDLFFHANQMAHWLVQQGVKPLAKIGLCLGRNAALFSAIIATQKIGAIYVPLDPTLPEARLHYMCEAAQLNCVITNQSIAFKNIKVMDLNLCESVIKAQLKEFTAQNNPGNEIAYIIFTSGSTGQPKPTALYAHSLVNLVEWARNYFTADELSGYSAVAPISFDASIFDIFVPILCGGAIVLSESILHVAEHPYRPHIRLFSGTHSAIKAIAQANSYDFTDSSIFFYGEAVQLDTVEKLMNQFQLNRVFNMYGPAETTVYVTEKTLKSGMSHMTIGKPINNTTIYIMDERFMPVDEGVTGEIYIGGIPVGQGYLGDPELSERHFLPDHLQTNVRMYKTGDLGRLLPSGEIMYMGRKDFQVKLAGRRVDIQEIETSIRSIEDVLEVAIIADRKEELQSQNLYAFYQSRTGQVLDEVIKAHLAMQIPTYMHPGRFILINKFPVSHNGKLDRKALLHKLHTNTVQPSLDNQGGVASLWKRILQKYDIDVTKTFFENGGTSLDVPAVLMGISEGFKVSLTVSEFFKHTTIDALAKCIENKQSQAIVPQKSQQSDLIKEQPLLVSDANDIAIIGIGLRLPGQIKTKRAFWDFLITGKPNVAPLSAARLELYESGKLESLGLKVDECQGSYFESIHEFDAAFFNIPEHEAAYMDPQQRWLLETVWNALEDAGYNPKQLSKERNQIGCFVGASFSDYQQILERQQQSLHPYAYTGQSLAFLANRTSYYYDFNGPSLTIDTTCSSSMTALHLAIQSLRLGESEMAVVSGCSLLLNLTNLAHWKQFGVLSSTGRCATFSEEADGFAPGEGIFTLLLKPLREARIDDNPIYAVVKGIAVNHDGNQKMSLTATSPAAQKELFARVCDDADCYPSDINYIEAHGTGTRIGDPIEIDAYSEIFGLNKESNSCPLGSVKTLIGHTGPAAGLASIVKCLLSFEKGILPPTPVVGKINSEIDLAKTPFFINQKAIPWDFKQALVASLGFGGANAFVMLQKEQYLEKTEHKIHSFALTPCTFKSVAQPLRPNWIYQRVWHSTASVTLEVKQSRQLVLFATEALVLDEISEQLCSMDQNVQGVLLESESTLQQCLNILDAKTNHLIYFIQEDKQASLNELLEKSVGYLTVIAKHCVVGMNKNRIQKVSIVVREGLGQSTSKIVNRALSGLQQSFQSEIPTIDFRLIRCHPSASLKLISTEILSTAQENEVYLENEQRLVDALVSTQTTAEPPVTIRHKGGYVITGASGGLAQVLTQWLVDAYDAQVYCLSRQASPSVNQNVYSFAVDVADEHSLSSTLEVIRRIGPIHGVLHLAGQIETQPISQKSYAQMRLVMNPKIQGTLNLELLTRKDNLDFIVLFSSIASIIGNAFQAEYAYANDWMNHFAKAYHQKSRPILSINWGTWYESGMVKEKVMQHDYYRLHLQHLISNERGCQLLQHALTLNLPELVIASDWQLESRLKPVATESKSLTPPLASRSTSDWLINLITAKLKNSKADCSVDRSLIDMGIDSVAAVDIVVAINQYTGLSFKPTLLFEVPTIEKLARLITERSNKPLSPPELVVQPDIEEAIEDRGIAIIGLACTFPGAKDADEFWDRLVNGDHFITEAPISYKSLFECFSTERSVPGTTYSKWGGYLPADDKFDPLFFNISNAEALEMDPQQRLALRLSWEVLESAGYVAELRDKEVGVYIGTMTTPYREAHYDEMTAKTLLSNSNAILANRISYFHGFKGPSIMCDTLCSSSLVALDMAVGALRQGRCPYALVGGIRVGIPLEHYIGASRMNVLSPQGRCASFSEGGDGFVPGEGGVMLLLKSLKQAKQSGDTILAVIKGISVNHCGQGSGMAAPSAEAQSEVVRQALADAGLKANQLSYIEAHGTGTELGDPIEVSGLTAIFSTHTANKQYCALGSVKSNIGHTEPAAGLAGVAKVILALKNQYLPATIHLTEPNRHIEFSDTPFYLLPQGKPWTIPLSEKRRAGVSSFGIGGTNAHVVLEEWSVSDDRKQVPQETYPAVVVLSAKNELSLLQQKQRLLSYLKKMEVATLRLEDIAYTLAVGRQHFSYRFAEVVNNREALIELLEQNDGDTQIVGRTMPRIGFLFTGQGCQYLGMGQSLFEWAPVFRERLIYCEQLLANELTKPLRTLLWHDEQALRQTCQIQPCLFAFEYSLAMQLKAWGIEPDMVLGHSLGEYVAACIAGVMDVETGLKQVLVRARLIDEQGTTPSGMLAVMEHETAVMTHIQRSGCRVDIAGINNSELVTVAGFLSEIEAFSRCLEQADVRYIRLDVSHGFHSYALDPMLQEFEQALSILNYSPPQIPVISNVTGQAWTGKPDAVYWRNHVRMPVRYADCLHTIAKLGCDILIEIGPDAVMIGMGQKVLKEDRLFWGATLKKGQDDVHCIQRLLADLHQRGVKINWQAVFAPSYSQRIQLPTYPFESISVLSQINSLPIRKPQLMLTPKITHYSIGNKSMDAFTKATSEQKMLIQERQSAVQALPIAQQVKQIIADALKIDIHALSLDAPLIELGADSLILSSALSTLNKSFSRQLSMRQLFGDIKTTNAVIHYFETI